ncbi:vanadium-dependent haloperoxidase [Gramella sp. GC03-9]|uniref:Vanadium-dependent haloperoxidase n=1 Tax=Christiangramia oceanisediminis TaxID=2920386 RepID=A0A9X2I3S3_9FLAO|nr:vanadium-dependent haloperoxidase [Gramella oceanisediminis]MCP9198827.1 vanadium-dependent haloperoxidase [Gramella oceanisediminis]
MKTTIKIFGGLFIFIGMISCENDSIEPEGSDLFYAADAKVQNFNNGMINSYSNEVVLQWNELLSEYLDQQLPQPIEVKIYAMVTIAMHDALNNVIPKYETYALDNSNANFDGITKKNIHSIADAAVSQAARDMIATLYPVATTAANEQLSTLLSSIEDSELKSRGIQIGKDAAQAMLAKRAGDVVFSFTSYSGGSEPGDYQANYPPFAFPTPMWPVNAVFGANIGELTPFGILSSDQFMDEAPYAINSDEYLADYNEVKELGCNNCPLRTPEQTQISFFWRETSSSSMNRLTRSLVEERKLDGWEAARLIGLIQMSVIDSYIASFEEKFYYAFWRPITAIRAGDVDGNDATIGDVNWSPSSPIPTPPNPTFPPSNAYCGGAAAEIFRAFFHSDIADVEITSPYYLPDVSRHIKTFSEMASEKGIFGVYAGYDFRQGVEVGERHGSELGKFLFENNLREIKKIQ